MVIHIRGTKTSDTSTMLAHFVERQRGRELRLGKRLIGWNLNDTIVMRSEGVSATKLQQYVRHFAPQRHVVFDHQFPAAAVERYFSFAREMRNYVFAFLKTPTGEHYALQKQLKERAKNASCEIVTLNPDRSIQQLEVLLLSASRVLGTDDPLVLPEAPARRLTRPSVRKTPEAA